MKDNQACAEYFKKQSGWDRCFLLMKRKWKSLGRTGGRISLRGSTQEEREAVGRFFGRRFDDDCIVFSLAEFESALQQTIYSRTSFTELLESYFGEKLVSNQELKHEEEMRRLNFMDAAVQRLQDRDGYASDSAEWIRALRADQTHGYSIIMNELKICDDFALTLVENIGQALTILERMQAQLDCAGIPLAVLAAKISNNPHYLDRDTAPGKLLVYALCWFQEKSYPQSEIERKQILLEANVLPDYISSQVAVLGIHLYRTSGMHLGMEEFCRMREPLVLTAYNLRSADRAVPEFKEAFIVENEMVFDYLAEAAAALPVSIICTSGQLHKAAFDLIALLAAEDCNIYYSGDLDPEGMGIADRLWQKYPAQIHIWRMGQEEYRKSVSHEHISDRSLTMLSNLQNQELLKTAELVQRKKCAGYQENLLEELKADILAAGNAHLEMSE